MTIRTALSATLLAALLSAGCSAPADEPAEPAETSTVAVEESAPVEQASPASTPSLAGDEAERFELAASAFGVYWDVINQTYADGGAEQATEDMLRVMAGQQLDFWASHFADWKAQGHRYEGVNRVLYANPAEASLSPDGGVAEIDFCVDMTATRAYTADGDPLPKDGGFQSGVAVLQWIDGTWKVAGHREGTGNKDQC